MSREKIRREKTMSQDELPEQQPSLSALVSSTGIGRAVDRVIKDAGPQLCAMTGYAREELLGRSTRLLYPTEEEFERAGRIIYGMVGEGGVGVVETRWRRKDGAVIDVLLSLAPVARDNPSAGVTFTALDISPRKRSEEEIARLASIVLSSDDAILSKRLDGTITSWNRGAEHVYGYKAAEVVGRSVDVIVPPERAGELRDILARIGRGERIERYETDRTREHTALEAGPKPVHDARQTVLAFGRHWRNPH
jgi:PAS domain S-box-containing protein